MLSRRERVDELRCLSEEYLTWWKAERHLGRLDPVHQDKVEELYLKINQLSRQLGMRPFEAVPDAERYLRVLTAHV
jgi:hypothetical protein